MTNKTEFRFYFEIINDETDEVIQRDWTLFCPDQIKTEGAVETVDIHVGHALRALRRQIAREMLKVEFSED